MPSDSDLLHCYNKGCGQKFDPNNNPEGACLYHPGPPYFHDAYKIWNCCGKKSVDFGTWLSYKGCATGQHNSTKPEESEIKPPQVEQNPPKKAEYIVWNGLNKPAERPSDPAERRREMRSLSIEIGEPALQAIQRQKELLAISNDGNVVDELEGATCKNNACKAIYSSLPENGAGGDCVHHPGSAVFHEGMKYWSCCEKKTSNFSAFLDQEGCTTGKHLWAKNEKVDKLREDWFSRSGHIHINVYCKGALPDQSVFETDGLVLRIKLIHGYGNKESDLDFELFGEIITGESKVILTERKVEVVLKQATPEGWPKLRYDPPSKN